MKAATRCPIAQSLSSRRGKKFRFLELVVIMAPHDVFMVCLVGCRFKALSLVSIWKYPVDTVNCTMFCAYFSV